MSRTEPVVVLDIDGTLGDYHAHFLRFAEGWLGKEMPDPAALNPALPLHKHMKVSKARYRECKLSYRRGGLKRSMPVHEGARELSVALRRGGARVWVATTRPFKSMENIDADTTEWLRRNRIQFDDILWGEHKYRNVVRLAGQSKRDVLYGIDDLPEMIWQADGLSVPTLIMDQPYNRSEPLPKSCARVHHLIEAQEHLLIALGRYKKGQPVNELF